MRLEAVVTAAAAANNQSQLIDQVLSSNLVRLVADCSYAPHDVYKLENLKHMPQVISLALDSMPPHLKSNLVSYLYLSLRKLSPQCRQEVLKNRAFANSSLAGGANGGGVDGSVNKSQLDSHAGNETNPMDFNTPSSPPISSLNINSLCLNFIHNLFF